MKTILVADDELGIRDLYSDIFKEAGYNVLLAATGAECLDLVSKNTVDLIILNSAYAGYESNSKAWLAEQYLVKSGNLDELKDTVRKIVAR